MRMTLRAATIWLACLILAGLLTACHKSTATTLQPPSTVSVTGGDTQATVSWNTSSGATGYNVYWNETGTASTTSSSKAGGVTSAYTITGLTDGTTYYVFVTAVNGGGESAASSVVSVTPSASGSAWTWLGGSTTVNALAAYGTQGTAAPGNVPGAMAQEAVAVDSNGYDFLFGGNGYNNSSTGYLQDLWRWDGTNWTWVSGGGTLNTSGIYGTINVTAASNMPGGRGQPCLWADSSANLWMFGGYGYDGVGTLGYLNGLWKWDGTNWTWVAGAQTANATGSYAAGPPGGRNGAASWIDSSGNLWMFGGYGYDGSSTLGYLNDLWEWNGTSWTFIKGSQTASAQGVYGTEGTAASANTPGARSAAATWVDSSGNFWLFGGYGYATVATPGYLNDLWKFDGTNWTWEGGSNAKNSPGVYGTLGTAASGNVPGARDDAAFWKDGNGYFWLFGGYGQDVNTTTGYLNDLWKWDGTNWTYVAGDETVNQTGVYGTQGTADTANKPGSRRKAVGWYSSSGKLLLFGGKGYDSGGTVGRLNDLWSWSP